MLEKAGKKKEHNDQSKKELEGMDDVGRGRYERKGKKIATGDTGSGKGGKTDLWGK